MEPCASARREGRGPAEGPGVLCCCTAWGVGWMSGPPGEEGVDEGGVQKARAFHARTHARVCRVPHGFQGSRKPPRRALSLSAAFSGRLALPPPAFGRRLPPIRAKTPLERCLV